MTYQPGLWHDYFVMVGGGSAALTGLVFVAMTLHLPEIVSDPVQRHRSHRRLRSVGARGRLCCGGCARRPWCSRLRF
jgi:hypothetical protein